MKKWILLLLCLTLAGCGHNKMYVDDNGDCWLAYDVPVQVVPVNDKPLEWEHEFE